MNDRRRFPRYRIDLPVSVRDKGRSYDARTWDVSRHGLFLETKNIKPLRQLLQLTIIMPDSNRIEVMGMVARVVENPRENGPGPGMGIDFFTMSSRARNKWDEFIIGLENREKRSTKTTSRILPKSAHGEQLGKMDFPLDEERETTGIDDLFEEIPENPSVPETGPTSTPPPLPPEAYKKSSVPNLPAVRKRPRFVASFMVRMKDRASLNRFFTRDISAGGMFLKTPLLKKKGSKVELVIVHPENDREFRIAGTVVRKQDGSDGRPKGLAIRFDDLGDGREEELSDFIKGGVETLEEESSQVKEMANAIRASVESGDADALAGHAALGFDLLEKERYEEAIEAFRKCIDMDPDYAPAHKGLKEAFTAVGDVAMAFHHLKEFKRLEKTGKTGT